MHMGKTLGVRKGAWTHEEDKLLRACIQKYGEGKWYLVPQRAGLNRCRKSCRLRWLNYLTPNINRRSFAEDEVDMILRLHKLLGNRWSLIAGRLPGRTANDVKNYWHTNLLSKVASNKEDNKKVEEKPKETMQTHVVIRPRPRTFSKHSLWLRGKHIFANDDGARECATPLVVANDVSGPSECATTPPVFTNDNGSTECATQIMLPIGGSGGVGVGDCAGQTSLGTVPQSIQWWESLLNLDNQVGDEGKGTCSLINGQEGNSILEFSNVEELIPCQRSRLLSE